MSLFDNIPWDNILTVLSLLGGGYGLRRYIDWRQNTETFESRQRTLGQDLQGKKFTDGQGMYKIEQIDYVEENTSRRYHLKKWIPVIRELQGATTITVCSIGAHTREYVWEEEHGREDFNKYLCQVCNEDYPSVEYKKMESVTGNPSSIGPTKEIQLKVHSLDSNEIAKTVEKIPAFHTYYFNNYPGNVRFRDKK